MEAGRTSSVPSGGSAAGDPGRRALHGVKTLGQTTTWPLSMAQALLFHAQHAQGDALPLPWLLNVMRRLGFFGVGKGFYSPRLGIRVCWQETMLHLLLLLLVSPSWAGRLSNHVVTVDGATDGCTMPNARPAKRTYDLACPPRRRLLAVLSCGAGCLRRFTIEAVEDLISTYTPKFTDPNLATLFANCLPNTVGDRGWGGGGLGLLLAPSVPQAVVGWAVPIGSWRQPQAGEARMGWVGWCM